MKVLAILMYLSTMGICGWYLYLVYGIKPEEGKESEQPELKNIAFIICGFLLSFFLLIKEIAS